MKSVTRLAQATVLGLFLLVSACEELQLQTDTLSGGSSTAVTEEKLSEHDAALRFLTAFIRQDREMALRYATVEAVSKLDWNRSHGGNIPYYDDKMILHFNGGWARVYFHETDGSYRVSDLAVHHR
ncbi:MAG: hypothetical protein WD342_11195 [Verrucomicrobiales bacterium]